MLKKLYELDPNHAVLAPQTLLDLAGAYKQLRQFTEAKESVKKVLQMDDGSAQGHRVMGQIHMEADEFDEAVFQFKKAIELQQVIDSSTFSIFEASVVEIF